MKAVKIILIILVILDVFGYIICRFKLDQKFLKSFEPKYRKMAEKSKLKNQIN